MLDPSVQRSFDQLEARAQKAGGKARAALGREAKGQAQDAQRAALQAAAAEEKRAAAHVRAVERVNAQIARAEASAAADADRRRQASVRADQRAFDQRLRASKKAHDAEERDIMRVAAAAERAQQRRAAAEKQQSMTNRTAFGREFGHRAVSNLGQAARFGMGIAGQIARGAGVDVSLSASAARNVELETQAIDLSNAGYNPSAAPTDAASKRVDPMAIQKDVKEAADANRFSRVETMGGLQAFVGKTGDLETGRAVLKDLGALSKATGTELGDMVDAAGDVASVFDGMKSGAEKAKMVVSVMRSIAGQGKLGAVEIKNLAAQMAKLGTSATAFEGDAGDNMALMGAFAQLARQKGGATSATIAAGSVTSMVNTLRTPARIKAFEAEGVEVVNKETGMLRNPEQILLAALAKTGGDPMRLKKMYANVQGARAIEGSATTFRQARARVLESGGTEEEATKAGLKAVAEELDKFKKVAMGEGEIRESLNRALNSQASKAQLFNNRMDDVAANLQAKMAPALERAAPGLIKLAEATASVVAWAAENPGKAIVAAIVASIAKAGIETAISQGIANLIKGGAGGAVPPGAGGGMGTAGKTLAVGAAALVGFSSGAALDSADADADRAAENRTRATKLGAQNATHRLRMAAKFHADDPAEVEKAQRSALDEGAKRSKDLEARIANADRPYWNGYVSAGLNWATAGAVGNSLGEQSQIDQDNASKADMKAELAELKAEMAKVSAKLSGNLNVTVTNQPGPSVDPGGRDGPPKP